ncbi:NAD(P)-dependent oxidoreductase [Candidatus Daviesbacteria bacterium]|nr:NAD(P)-dependent oxidoreductase [Candidatus Daviesbacteria bacterium]
MKKLLIFGGSGLVGSKFIESHNQTFEINAPPAKEVDILNKNQILKALEDLNPDSVINFAAYTNVEQAEEQTEDKAGVCFQINAMGAKNVADACRILDKHLLHISTEYVFDGTKAERPYVEEDKPNPINWYGHTKYFGEQFVLGSGCKSSIVRISMPYSAYYEFKKDVARFFLEQLKLKNPIRAVVDQLITPTLVDDIADALSEIVKKRLEGVINVSCKSSTTPFDFAKTIAKVFGLNESLVNSISLTDYNLNKKAKMLKNSALDPSKFDSLFPGVLHTLDESVNLFKVVVE